MQGSGAEMIMWVSPACVIESLIKSFSHGVRTVPDSQCRKMSIEICVIHPKHENWLILDFWKRSQGTDALSLRIRGVVTLFGHHTE